MKSGKGLVMKVPKGNKAIIQFPVRPQIVSFTGYTWARNQGWEFKNEDGWSMLQETAQCAATKVITMNNSVIFQGGDGSIWGMGYRS